MIIVMRVRLAREEAKLVELANKNKKSPSGVTAPLSQMEEAISIAESSITVRFIICTGII